MPDEARRIIRDYQDRGEFTGKMPAQDKQAQRVARALSEGKRGRAIYGHGGGEYHHTRVTPFQLERIPETEYRMGSFPYRPGKKWVPVRGAVPQPADLLRLVRQYTHKSVINFGVYGWLKKYLNVLSKEDEGWFAYHHHIERQWLIDRLEAMGDHYHQADDPEYLELAHDLMADNLGYGPDTCIWGWVYGWSVRDSPNGDET